MFMLKCHEDSAQPGKVLKLKKKPLRIEAITPKLLQTHFWEVGESVGLKAQTEVDPCLFISDKVICVLYVDDTLFWSPKVEHIDEVINKLRKKEKLN